MVELRERYFTSHQTNQKIQINYEITNALQKILVVAENYPKLQVPNNLHKLQKSSPYWKIKSMG
ncbi:LemA family protein [Xenorhabdus lircayensis]|uniref:LemA family protein n=1 Tax=Xenorhabdus lircayensis TaxID=2763499 RepID=UPI0038CD33B9